MDKKERIQYLVSTLNEASRAYYATDQEIMTNLEYDKLYDELLALEKETGMILSSSPTQRVGYEVLSNLEKVTHASPMLSLDKTKDRDALRSWLEGHEGVLSWKLDGLTIVLTYNHGELERAVTRGNGSVGELITNNAKVFDNIPLKIQYQGELVVRGEAVISYQDFELINMAIELESEKYKNPRNLVSGSVRQLNNRITKERHVKFIAFNLVSSGLDMNSRMAQFEWLKQQGFDVVEHYLVTPYTILDTIQSFSDHIALNPFPSDGLVLTYEDIAYGISLGNTAKFPRHSMAFKWQDEEKETTIREIEWSASRTGLINPVAIFDPIELEGTTVSRASLHNISIMENLQIGLGDIVRVFKANMIIPQISENLTRSGKLEIPSACPVCGLPTLIKNDAGIKTLYCTNPDCQAKHLKRFAHFVSRDALNVDGLSEATLEKLIGLGYIKEFPDLFSLSKYRLHIENLEGFGKKSYTNLIEAIETARHTDLVRFIYSLGIPNFGLANAKLIVKNFKGDINAILNASIEALVMIDGVGEVMAKAYVDYMQDKHHRAIIQELLNILELEAYVVNEDHQILEGLTFCITGSVHYYENRNAFKDVVEKLGGKVTGSVSSKTDYLVNNDVTSTSGKNKKAKDLNIPIIDEDTFVAWVEEGKVPLRD